jgi:hypothetical protein
MDEILTFPPPPPQDFPNDPKSIPKIPPFHSGVWDLRLQKTIESRRVNDANTSREISEQVDQLKDSQLGEVPDLREVFRPPKIDRPEIPLYIQNIRADRQVWLDSFKKRVRPSREDIASAGSLFKQRIVQQRSRAKQRRQQRFTRAKDFEQKHLDFVKDLPHSPYRTELDIKQIARAREAARAAERKANLKRTEDIVRQTGEINFSKRNRI